MRHFECARKTATGPNRDKTLAVHDSRLPSPWIAALEQIALEEREQDAEQIGK